MSESSKTAYRPRTRMGAALSAVAAVAILASAALGQDEVLPGEPNPPWDDGALPAEVIPGLEHVRPVTWNHVLVGPDGQTLSVYFDGPPECTGLADVEVEERTDEISILLWVGDVPGGAEVCVELAQLYRVVVLTRRSSRVARSWTCHRAEACAGGSHIARPSGTLGGGAGPGAPDRDVIGRPGFGTGGTEPRGAARRERMEACRARR